MFQAQNRETINGIWKVAVSFKIIMTTSVTRSFSQNHTKPARPRPRPQCARPRARPIFLVSDRSCPKTNGLRRHHLWQLVWGFAPLTAPVVTTTAIILSSSKIQYGAIPVLAYPDCRGKEWVSTSSASHRYCWRRSIVVRTLVSAGKLSISCTRLLAGWVTTLWLSCPLSISQHGQLSHPSLRGR